MRPADQLATFVHDALRTGRSRAEIRAALSAAGWTDSEVAGALAAWAETDFTPPVPRPRPFVSAREAFTYGLMFVALAMTAWHLVTLSFALIDIFIPDVVADQDLGLWRMRAMRFSIASLVVFLPLFLLLNQRTQRMTRSDPGQRRSLVRKWVSYVTLFLASMALLGDLIAVIYSLLNGDMTLRFAAKTLTVAVVAGIIFLYFRGEMDDRDAR